VEARLLLPGAISETEDRLQFYFTERLSGMTQFGGSPTHQFLFTLDRKTMDVLRALQIAIPYPEVPETPETLPEPTRSEGGPETENAGLEAPEPPSEDI
jgi:hypothetical protein